jgi:PadR family transcriptional regulator PadR
MLGSEVRKGSAEVLILGTIEERARHGYEIARLIETRSDGAITFNSATLYPTLRKLEQRKLIARRWVEKTGQRRRRYYRITPAGRVVLREQRSSWQRFVDALTRVAKIREA